MPIKGVKVKKNRIEGSSVDGVVRQSEKAKGLTFDDIRDGIGSVLEKQKAKLISQTSKPEAMEMKVKTADERLLSLTVNRTGEGYDLALS